MFLNTSFDIGGIRVVRDSMFEPLPDYVSPEKTGDELSDELSDLIEYRAYQHLKREREEYFEQLKLRYMHIVKIKKQQLLR